ncbi:MAG: DUF3343 domain-containing protein [Zhaonellaceae bacterium]|nr:DUF3343 domain-containing protein [Clostridia bacterium]
MRDSYYLIAFANTHVAMKAHKHLREKGFNIAIMPTLRKITASCGLSIRFSSEDLPSIQKAVSEINIDPSLHQFYKVETNMGKCTVTKLG